MQSTIWYSIQRDITLNVRFSGKRRLKFSGANYYTPTFPRFGAPKNKGSTSFRWPRQVNVGVTAKIMVIQENLYTLSIEGTYIYINNTQSNKGLI